MLQVLGRINPTRFGPSICLISDMRRRVSPLRFHNMRQTYATWLILAGHPLTTVAKWRWHAKASVPLDTYAHVIATVRDTASDTVGALLFGDDQADTPETGTSRGGAT